MRSRLDLPLPLGPVRISAPPAGRRKSSPRNTSRSPGWQARSSPARSAATGKVNEPGQKKRLRRGRSGAAKPTADSVGRRRGLGDKPVRVDLTHMNLGLDWDRGLLKMRPFSGVLLTNRSPVFDHLAILRQTALRDARDRGAQLGGRLRRL